MHKMAENYICEKEKQIANQKQREKNDFLLREGLYTKTYSDKAEYSPDYPYSEFDENTQQQRYYQKEPIEVTDEEYDELKKYSSARKTTAEKSTNAISVFLLVVAIAVFAIGLIYGIIQAGNISEYSDDVAIFVALQTWVKAFFIGSLFLGISEIIKLLHNINIK